MTQRRPICNHCLLNLGIGVVENKEKDSSLVSLPLESFINKNVKLAFECYNDRIEYMWVFVTGLATNDDEELQGVLNNDPVLPSDYQYGDIFEFKRSEIYELYDS